MTLGFGPFTLNARARRLSRGATPIHLSPKAFDLLVLLIDRRPEAISKQDIHRRLWPDTFVSDGNLAVLVAEIRTALGDSARESRFVRTVQRFGYAFCGTVAPRPEDGISEPERCWCWLVWDTWRVPLARGEHVLGRGTAADVRIDAVGISRRHAMIDVGEDLATLVDLSSKNGTFVNGARVAGSVPLPGDAEIRLGPMTVRFCTLLDLSSTQTWDAAARAAGLR